jgi:hypothetical protein
MLTVAMMSLIGGAFFSAGVLVGFWIGERR